MAETEKYWDDLGIEWRAVAPDPIAVTPRLARSLRLQKAMLKIAFLGGAVASMLGLFLGLRAIFIGLYRWSLHSTNAWFFMTQGTAALAVSVMIAIAVVSPGIGLTGRSGSLADMLDSSIRGAAMLLRAIRLGLWACGLLALFGAGGEVIRDRIYTPSGMPPLLVLALVIAVALMLLLAQRIVANRRAKYTYLKSVLVEGER